MKSVLFGFLLAFVFASLYHPEQLYAETLVIDEFSLTDIPPTYFPSALEPAKKQLLASDYTGALKTLEAFPVKGADRSSTLQKAIFLRALSLLYSGKNSEALKEFEQYLKLRPSSADAIFFRGIAFSHLGDTTNALSAFDEALFFGRQSFITPSELHLEKAIILQFLTLKDKAIAELTLALAAPTPFPKGYAELSYVYIESADKDNAVKNIRTALAADPKNPAWLILLCRSLLLKPDRVNGRKDLEEAKSVANSLVNDKSNTNDITNRAIAAFISASIELGDFESAEKMLNQAIKDRPQDEELQNQRQQLKIERSVPTPEPTPTATATASAK